MIEIAVGRTGEAISLRITSLALIGLTTLAEAAVSSFHNEMSLLTCLAFLFADTRETVAAARLADCDASCVSILVVSLHASITIAIGTACQAV